ncbi:MAG: transcriptional regulator FtsR [Actinomycetota bacterium]
MPLSRSRDYLSIGEVLDNVRADFPDVSISKIRFLESEGLITPRRTGSGYRMFYEDDVNRLRYILTLQRDHFLPLKVIRERLAQADSNGGYPTATAAPAAPTPAAPAATEAAVNMAGVSLSRDELASTAGLSDAQMRELEEFAILDKDAQTYNEDDLIVAKAARRFFDFGVQARHLKMYRQFAEREAAFFEQIVSPAARRRDPGAAGEAARSLHELAGLSRQMKDAALRASLRNLL